MNIRLYSELDEKMQQDLGGFMDLMIEKLHKNRKKRTVEESDVPAMLELLMREVGEFIRQYMMDKDDPNAPRELADIANFAFLLYTAVKR